MFYGIYYASFYTQYVQLLAAYGLAAPTSEEILEISPSSFQGALAGSGSLSVPHAYTLTSGLVEPLCSGAICQQSIYALAPNTPYQVCRRPTFAADLVFTQNFGACHAWCMATIASTCSSKAMFHAKLARWNMLG